MKNKMKIIIDNQPIIIRNANTFLKKLLGLMGEDNLTYGMYFKNTNSIHTFFMKTNIDVIGLNNQNEVIYKAINIPKNKIITIKNPIKNTSILELPPNTSTNIHIGQKLTFISE